MQALSLITIGLVLVWGFLALSHGPRRPSHPGIQAAMDGEVRTILGCGGVLWWLLVAGGLIVLARAGMGW